MSRHRCKKAGPRPAPPPTIDLRVEELDAIVERTKRAALSPDDHAKLKAAMDTLAFLASSRSCRTLSKYAARSRSITRVLFRTIASATRATACCAVRFGRYPYDPS